MSLPFILNHIYLYSIVYIAPTCIVPMCVSMPGDEMDGGGIQQVGQRLLITDGLNLYSLYIAYSA